MKNEMYFDVPAHQWSEVGGLWTAREIAQQPAVWLAVQNALDQQRGAVDAFLAPLLANPALRIILTGAGTSAFIGECLLPGLLKHLGRRVEAIATTDIVSNPGQYLQADVPTLMVSFGRSGSSPESVAAVDLADLSIRQCHHLMITCNRNGALYRRSQQRAGALAIVLPEETHDRAFAMTSSFTSMLLTAASLFRMLDGAAASANAGAAALALMEVALPTVKSLVACRFERVVFIGSGALRGLAREAALKMMELTDGRVVVGFDSPLGFRHGPKTIVNLNALVVVMLSNDPHTRRYDMDLVDELRADGRAGGVLLLSAPDPELVVGSDCVLVPPLAGACDIQLALAFIVFAQMVALFTSLDLGVRPDTPSKSGTVNRVVQGVTIYSLPQEA